MEIAFGTDNAYAQHLGVALASVLTHLDAGVPLSVTIITDFISAENHEKIASLKTIRDFSIRYLIVSLKDFRDLPFTGAHITLATYFRLKLPYLLPQLDKVLYLDTDLIAGGDLSGLWNTVLGANWAAGVADIAISPHYTASIGMGGAFAFNAGVLLMNLAALRHNGFAEKCAAFIRRYEHAIQYADQDILNAVCCGHVLWLDPKFNLYANIDQSHKLDKYLSPYSRETLLQARAHPVIIHYTGPVKPWSYASRHSRARCYMQHIKQTPWRDYRFPDRNFRISSRNIYSSCATGCAGGGNDAVFCKQYIILLTFVMGFAFFAALLGSLK